MGTFNRQKWYSERYEKFGADLEKEYCQKLKETIKADKKFGSIANWIRFYGDKYLNKKKIKNFSKKY